LSARHLLSIESLDEAGLKQIIERACAFADGASAPEIDATVVNLFHEPSTRTRLSFERAAGCLGMQSFNIEPQLSSATKGESLTDTAATLQAMGMDCLILRHADDNLIFELAQKVKNLHLVNAGSGVRAHPSQALLDAAVLQARGLSPAGLKLAIVGDIRHSRVAASHLALWPRLGAAEIRLAGPHNMLPDAGATPGVTVHDNMDEAIAGANVVMMLRIQRERIDAEGWPDSQAYFADWGLSRERLSRLAPDSLVMHPGPVNRDVEISSEVADGPNALILDQVRMGVFARMAIFEWLLRGQD